MATDYYGSPSAGMGSGYGQQGYGTMSSGATDNRVLVTVRVPANAEIWFDDDKTSQTGSLRSFISPPLNSDGNFVYHLRARWTENGQPVEKTRRLEVHAGDRLFVNLFNPRQGMGGTSAGQYGTEQGATGENRALEHRDQTLDNRNRSTQEENADRALENRTAPSNRTTTPSGNTANPLGTTTNPPAATNPPAQPRSQNQTSPPNP
jgi:uncharacterized protein (TIGR03000 family)